MNNKLCAGVVVTTVIAACLVGCGVARQSGAYAALPFAAIGDSVLLPFQGMGRASSSLISLGDEHLEYVREKNKGKVTVAVAELTPGFYYVPGWLLWPFDALTPTNLYPMTKACSAVAMPDPALTNKPARASGGHRAQFKEW